MVAGFAMDVHALCDAEFPQKPLKKATYIAVYAKMQYKQPKCYQKIYNSFPTLLLTKSPENGTL